MILSRCCIQCVSKSGRPRSSHRTGKGQSSSQFPRRVVVKNVLTIRQLHSFPMLCGSQQTGRFLKRWECRTTLLASCETCMQVKKQKLEPDTKQWTGSKLGKENVKAVYCHPVYLISIQNTSCKMLGCMKHKLESRFPEVSVASDMQMTPPLWQKVKRN